MPTQLPGSHQMQIDDLLETYPHLKGFVPFLDLLNEESPRGKVLISSSFLEEQLGEVLQAFFIDCGRAEDFVEGGYAPLKTFSARITACYLLGLISEDERIELDLIRDIRNDFAHDIRTSFESQSVVSRCEQLKGRAMDYTQTGSGKKLSVPADGQFTTAAVSLILRLVNRAHYVSRERRSYKEWRR